MCALARFIESEGVATSSIALVKEHAAGMQPPRALWVPFDLGRPFGQPDDPAFQHRVLAHLLRLFEAPAGPALEDYPEEAPAADLEGWSCPIPVAAPQDESQATGPAERLQAELGRLAPWYEVGLGRRGRTTVGLFEAGIEAAATAVSERIDAPDPDLAELTRFKYAVEDLKAYYLEAAVERPDQVARQDAAAWLWRQTELGRQLRQLSQQWSTSGNVRVLEFGLRTMVPREFQD